MYVYGFTILYYKANVSNVEIPWLWSLNLYFD